jgi:hypothetical protein
MEFQRRGQDPVSLWPTSLFISWRLPDPYWLVSLLGFLPVLVAQRSVNGLNAAVAPDAPRNASYSGLNVVAIVIGGLLLLFAILGTILPLEEPTGQLPVAA